MQPTAAHQTSLVLYKNNSEIVVLYILKYSYTFIFVSTYWRTKSGRKVHGTNFAVENYRMQIIYYVEGCILYNVQCRYSTVQNMLLPYWSTVWP